MNFLSGLYSAGAAARNSLYETGFFKTRKLGWPVVSVGNLSAGGSGKTPFVIMLGELLTQKGYFPDVLSRGYCRRTRGVLRVEANGSAEEYGDEPLFIARKLRCPVIVGEDRYAAGLQAEHDSIASQSNALHLLDDGFQHRQLHRDFDIVLLNQEDLDDRPLPLGRLRESFSSLLRADAVAVESQFPIERLPKGDYRIWRMERRLHSPSMEGPVIAFCGIARPKRFFSELHSSGIEVRKEIAFRDHHRYSIDDIRRLVTAQQQIKGSSLITTEKDAINLGVHLTTLQPTVIPMEMRLIDAESAMKQMLNTLAERSGSSKSQ